MGRRPCCAKEGLNRGAWSAKEDAILTEYIKTHGEGKWRDLPKRSGLKRCGKSCRLRWLNYLRPDIKRGNISEDEELLIIKLHKLLGNRWSLIAGRLPGRTDNEIKNYWNTNLSKKLKTQHYSEINKKIIDAGDQNNKSESSNSEPHEVIRTRAMRCTKIYNIPPPPPQSVDDIILIKTTTDSGSNNDDVDNPQRIVDSTPSPFSLPLDLNIDELINSFHDGNDLFNVLDNHESTAVPDFYQILGPAKAKSHWLGDEAMQELDQWRELGEDELQTDHHHVVSEMRQFASLLECQDEYCQQN